MLNQNLEVLLAYYFQKYDMIIPYLALQIETNYIPRQITYQVLTKRRGTPRQELDPPSAYRTARKSGSCVPDRYSSSYGAALVSISRHRGISQLDLTSASSSN